MVSKANWGQIKRAVNVRVEKFHSVRKTYTYAFNTHCVCVCVLATQSHLTLCNSMDCSPPGSSVHGDSPGKNTGVGCHSLLQGIFATQGLNPGLLHCRQFFFSLNCEESPILTM